MKAECPEPLSPSDQVVALADRRKPVSPLRERRRVLPRRALRTTVHQAQPPQEPIEQLGDLEVLVEHRPVRLTARQHHLLTTERHPASAASQADGHPGRERLLACEQSRTTEGTRDEQDWGQKTIANPTPVGAIATLSISPRPCPRQRVPQPPPLRLQPARALDEPHPRTGRRRGCGRPGAPSDERRAPARPSPAPAARPGRSRRRSAAVAASAPATIAAAIRSRRLGAVAGPADGAESSTWTSAQACTRSEHAGASRIRACAAV